MDFTALIIRLVAMVIAAGVAVWLLHAASRLSRPLAAALRRVAAGILFVIAGLAAGFLLGHYLPGAGGGPVLAADLAGVLGGSLVATFGILRWVRHCTATEHHAASLEASRAELNRLFDSSTRDLRRAARQLSATDQDREQAEQTAREREIRLRAVVDHIIDAIVTFDDTGTIESVNPALEKMYGYRTGELIGKKFAVLLPEPDRGQYTEILANYLRTGKSTMLGTTREGRGLRSDGSSFPVEFAISEMWVQGRRMFTGIARDITERKKVERMKNEFISTVSHELRTPLTSIHGSLGLVTGGAAGELPERARGLLQIAVENSDRLVRLINDILDIEKIESGRVAYQPRVQALAPLLQRAADSIAPYAERHQVRLELDKPDDTLLVLADADRMLQVLVNLVSNAIKFSPPGGTVRVVMREHGTGARVEVVDQGAGVPRGFRSRIFTKFAQADASDTRRKSGTGLGLSIAKALVELHGGNIGFESPPGAGATFWFELPLVRAPARLVGRPGVDRPRVLVCEDDPQVARLMEAMLDSAGIDCDIAMDLGEARRKIGDRRYAAIVTDLALPDGDGIGLIQDLRHNPATRSLPVVVVSASAGERRGELHGSAIGVVDWLTKPIDQARFLDAMRSATGDFARHRRQVLHVEDDNDLSEVVAALLYDEADVIQAATLSQARALIAQQDFDLVILDLGMPDGSGLELLKDIGNDTRAIPVVVFSAQEAGPELANEVSAALVKTRTSSGHFLSCVRGMLDGRADEARRELQQV